MIVSCSISIAVEVTSEHAKSEFEKYIYQGKNEWIYWPIKARRTAKPEEVGMNSLKLVKAVFLTAYLRYFRQTVFWQIECYCLIPHKIIPAVNVIKL